MEIAFATVVVDYASQKEWSSASQLCFDSNEGVALVLLVVVLSSISIMLRRRTVPCIDRLIH